MIRTGLQNLLGPYLIPLEVAAVLGSGWYLYEHVKGIGYEQAMTEVAKAKVDADAKKALEIKNAEHSQDAELADLARYAADLAAHERDVRVHYLPGPVQQPPSIAAAASGGAVLHALPYAGAGCEERGGASQGPNVFPVLRDIAVAADALSAADRLQYEVK